MDSLFPREPLRLDDQVWHAPGWLSFEEQAWLLNLWRGWLAPPAGSAQPRMPNGTFMSVSTACLGWYWYPYRYSRFLDDTTGEAVKAFPGELGDLARRAVGDTYGASGDLFVFGGSRRRSFHGVTKVLTNGIPLTEPGERINITIRTVQ